MTCFKRFVTNTVVGRSHKRLTGLMEIHLWSAMRVNIWQEFSPVFAEEHCPKLNLKTTQSCTPPAARSLKCK